MRTREKRFGIALLLWALAACDDPSSTTPDDETPTFDEDEETPADEDTDDSGEVVDAGPSVRRDGGRDASRDASRAGEDDAGEQSDASSDTPGDGGRVTDSSVKPVDAGTAPGDGNCPGTETWDPAWVTFEEEVLRLTNEARAVGHNCDTKGSFGKAAPLKMEPRLRCSARLFSEQMAKTNTFSHTGADGSSLEQRLDKAGYMRRSTWGENIAKNQQTPAEVVAGWLDSDGHCANIMQPQFTEIGVGFYSIPSTNPRQRATTLWTQNFARPR